VQKSGANDRFLVNPTLRWRGQEWLLRGMGIGIDGSERQLWFR
jgi:hypothetical protein